MIETLSCYFVLQVHGENATPTCTREIAITTYMLYANLIL